MKLNIFCVFYHSKKQNKYFIYHSSGKYEESDEILLNKDNIEHSRLTKINIDEQNISLKEVLKEYCDKVDIWATELSQSKELMKKYDFFLKTKKLNDNGYFINTNESNIMRFFNNFSSKIYTNKTFDVITWSEYLYFEKTYNGALTYCNPGIYETIGYDLSMAYPNILSSELILNNEKQIFCFPRKEGKLATITNLNNLKYGLYNVEIKCNDEDFNKIFPINYKNFYTHYDIEFCLKYKIKYDIKIELIICENNALIYEQSDLIDGVCVFKMWLDRIKSLKKEFPKNGLIKLLSSSMWGYLSKINKRYYNDEELDENPDIKFDYYDNNEINYLCLNEKENKRGTTDYKLVNKTNPYTKNYRLKSFLQSFTRLIMAKIAMKIGIKKIVRINTDNITFDKKLMSEKKLIKLKNISPQFIEEAKTTGHFNIINTNNFKRL